MHTLAADYSAPLQSTFAKRVAVSRLSTRAAAMACEGARKPNSNFAHPVRKSAASVPAYRLHRAKDLGYVRLGGRVIYLGRAGSPQSHEKYKRIVAEWLATGRVPSSHGEHLAVETITISQLIDRYLQWARAYYVDLAGHPSTGLGPVEAAARSLRHLYGGADVASFGPIALRALRESMVQGGLCRNVINQRVACVKRIFKWAVADELVRPDVITALSAVEPLRKGRSGARETDPVRPVPDAHVEAVLPFLTPTLQAMVRLQRLTGMRSGELCVMRTCDIDTSNEVWLYRPISHKTAYRGHERIVRIGPRGQDVLAPLLIPSRSEAYVFSPLRSQCERQRKLNHKNASASDSRHYSPHSYRRALCYAMELARRTGNLLRTEFWHPHQLRHRHATAVREGGGLEAARILLGHRSVDQTAEYAVVEASLADTIALKLG